MAILLFTAITSFAIAFLILPAIIRYSLSKNLVDIPGRRKIHKKVTPTMGGIAIFAGFLVSCLIWIELEELRTLRYVIISLFIIFVVGTRDDYISLRPMMKLAAQVFVALILILFFNLRITSFYGLFGVYELPLFISYSLTVFTIIVVVNSFNLIDGLDGLAGTIASISLFAFGVWFFLADDMLFSTLAFGLLGGILAFLLFNWEPSEIFMGDSGALVIGLALSIITIHFIEFNASLPETNPFRYEGSIGTGICFIIIPLIDTLRVFIIRLTRKQSPFTPDKSHIHHSIMRLGFSHSKTTLILGGFQVVFIVTAFILRGIEDIYLLVTTVAMGTLLSLLLDRTIRSRVNV